MPPRKKTPHSVEPITAPVSGVQETNPPVAGGEAASPSVGSENVTNGQVAQALAGLFSSASPQVQSLFLGQIQQAQQASQPENQPVGGRRKNRRRRKPNPSRIVAAYGSVIHSDDFEVTPPEWVTDKDRTEGHEVDFKAGKWGPNTNRWLDDYYDKGKTVSAAGAAHQRMIDNQERVVQRGSGASLQDITGISSPEEAAALASEEFAVPDNLQNVKIE